MIEKAGIDVTLGEIRKLLFLMSQYRVSTVQLRILKIAKKNINF